MAALTYLDFDLSIEAISREPTRYRARGSSLAAGQGSSDFSLPFSAQDLKILFLELGRPRRGVRAIGSAEMQAAQAFGNTLFSQVFAGQVQSCLQRSLDSARQQRQGLRIRLRLRDVPELADLPWEFLYDPAQSHFLAYSTVTPLVRYLDLPQTVAPLAVQPPLKVLVMIANPRDHGYATLDVEDEWRKIQGALAGLETRGLVQVTRLEAATLSALQRYLRRDQYHIFHFVGHGGFDQQTQSGVLLLEDEQGRSRLVNGQYLGALLRDHFSLRLALLNACEGARTSRADPFAGVAQHLVQQGIPAVIAMQFEITDQAAITLSHEFYNALADNYGVDAALSEARKALFAAGNDIEWGTPVLYMRAQSGQLFELSAFTATTQPASPQTQSVTLPVAPLTQTSSLQRPTHSTLSTGATNTATNSPTQDEVPLSQKQAEKASISSRQEEPAKVQIQSTERKAEQISHAKANKATQATPLFAQKRRWGKIGLSLVGIIAVLYLSLSSFQSWQEDQRRVATAITSDEAGRLMLEKAPQLRLLSEQFGMIFVEVPGGDFPMGSTETQVDEALALCNQSNNNSCQRDWFTGELPQQPVSVESFWIMQTEVTNAQFRAFVEDGGYQEQSWWTEDSWQWRQANTSITKPRFWDDTSYAAFNDANQPVIGVSWYEAVAYARWLAAATKLDIRLPTEAQWEKAARGPEELVFPWGNAWDGKRVNYCDKNCGQSWKDEAVDDGYAYTAPVDSYPDGASPYGAFNMAGNVWEWTSSLDMGYPYQADDGREAETAADAGAPRARVVRGGSWSNDPSYVRAAFRDRHVPDVRYHYLGFRLVVAVAPQ